MAHTYSTLNNFPHFRGEPNDSGFFQQLVENQCYLNENIELIPDFGNAGKDIVPKYTSQYDLGASTKRWSSLFSDKVDSSLFVGKATGLPCFHFEGEDSSGLGYINSSVALFASGYTPLVATSAGVRVSGANAEQLEFISSESGKEGTWRAGGNKDHFTIKQDDGAGTFVEKIKITETEIQFALPINAPIQKNIITANGLEDFETELDVDTYFFIELGTNEVLPSAPQIWGEAGEEITFIASHSNVGTLTLSANIIEDERMPFVLGSDLILNAGDTVTFIRMPNGLYRKQ